MTDGRCCFLARPEKMAHSVKEKSPIPLGWNSLSALANTGEVPYVNIDPNNVPAEIFKPINSAKSRISLLIPTGPSTEINHDKLARLTRRIIT
jgi:hypothetical protein